MSHCDERTAKYRNDPRSSDELMALALSKDADADDDEYWKPIWTLQHRLPRIIETVKRLSESSDAKSRDAAATILGQNGVEEKYAAGQCAEFLLSMLPRELSDDVLSSIVHAVGHLHDPRSIGALIPLAKHHDADVRYAVVHGLSCWEDNRAIQALIELSADVDLDVRNWATFGLGSQIESDTPEIREALLARLQETDAEIRGEALVGLARCGDPRVIAPFLHELESDSPEGLRGWTLVSRVADAAIGNAKGSQGKIWLPVLEKLKSLGIGDELEIQSAIEGCAQ